MLNVSADAIYPRHTTGRSSLQIDGDLIEPMSDRIGRVSGAGHHRHVRASDLGRGLAQPAFRDDARAVETGKVWVKAIRANLVPRAGDPSTPS